MKHMRLGISLLGLLAMTAEVSAATVCDQTSAAALKTAAVQQELMVAGLTCNASQAYNRFVMADRPALQKSDADLMAYFKTRDGNEAGYDSYKTKVANLASNRSSAQGSRFCSDTARAFRSSQGVSLQDFVAGHRLLIAAPEACAVKYDQVEEASVSGPSYALPAAPYGAPPPPVARRYSDAGQRMARPAPWQRYADASDSYPQSQRQRYADAGQNYEASQRRYAGEEPDYAAPPPPRPRREQDYYLQGWNNGPYAWLPPRPRWYGYGY